VVTFYVYSVTDATGAELTGEVSAPDLPAAVEQLRLRELLGTGPAAQETAPSSLKIFSLPSATPLEAGLNRTIWVVYAALALVVGLFLLAVVLMATGVVGTPHT
jgi:hypothetical protein